MSRNRDVAVASNWSHGAWVHDAETGKPVVRAKTLGRVRTLAFADTHNWLALAGESGMAEIFDVPSGSRLCDFRFAGEEVRSSAFSQNDSRFAVGGSCASVELWALVEAVRGERDLGLSFLATLSDRNSSVKALAFSSDGNSLVGAGSGADAKGEVTIREAPPATRPPLAE